MSDPEEDPFAQTRMSLGEHLDELRKRLIRGLAAVAIAFFIGWFYYQEIADVVLRPMHTALARIDADQVEKYEALLAEDPDTPRSKYFLTEPGAPEQRLHEDLTVTSRMAAIAPTEPFLFALKIAGYFALAVGSPVLLWQLWKFVAAGLYSKERRLVGLTIPVSLVLFVAGMLFGYFLMVPFGLYFLITAFPPEEMQFLPSLSEYLSLLTLLTIALGIVFQMPLLMNILVRAGLVPRETFRVYRRHFIVGAVVLAAMLTPPDPYTQLMMAIPMGLLYEVGLFWTRFAPVPEGAEGAGA